MTYLCQTTFMQMIRTTLRLPIQLKKAAEKKAIEQETTLQDLFNRALKLYIDHADKMRAKKIVFRSHDLGVPLDNLTRDDIYGEPETP